MSTRNSCNTYFKIVGNFNPDEVSELLNLTPEKTWKIGDLRRNGTMYDFALWEIGRCTEYDVNFVLEIVPTIYVGDTNPCLAPPLDVIDFCHATRTEIDIDMYVYNSEDE